MPASTNFPLRLDDSTREKLRYIAAKNSRSMNKELDYLVKQHIAEYEKEHGEIPLPEKE